jgi:phosphatidate phosphatase
LPYLAVWLTVHPFKRGFFCNDDSIKYPYHEDTVTMGACAGGGIAIALVSVIN